MDSGEESEVEVCEGEFSGELPKKRGRFTIPENDEFGEEEERMAAEMMKQLFSKKLKSKTDFRGILAQLGNINEEDDDDGEVIEKEKQQVKTTSGKAAGRKKSAKCNEKGNQSDKVKENSKSKGNNNASEAKKWTNDEINALIDILEARPCVWDIFDKNYQ